MDKITFILFLVLIFLKKCFSSINYFCDENFSILNEEPFCLKNGYSKTKLPLDNETKLKMEIILTLNNIAFINDMERVMTLKGYLEAIWYENR